MPHVSVTIAGKSYRMACGPGEEEHLSALAKSFDDRITEMRGAFGEIGDMRLQVMAALTIADELGEAKRRLAAAEAEAGSLREAAARAAETQVVQEAGLAQGIAAAAERIERMAQALAGSESG